MKLNNIFVSIMLMLACIAPLSAEEQTVSVPVELTVDPYMTFVLQSRTVMIDAKDSEEVQRDIPAGSLFFGDMNRDLMIISNKEKNIVTTGEYYYGTDYKTKIFVQVVNNSKPFELRINIIPEAEGCILDLKTLKGKAPYQNEVEEKCALHVMVNPIKDVTQRPEYLMNADQWVSIPENGELILYDSRSEVISDAFAVTFAILNINPGIKAGKYGGKILWHLNPTLN